MLDTSVAMKTLLLILACMFLFSATNDCCLTDIHEELVEMTSSAHSDAEHQNESEGCEECQCAAFCSYNLVSKIDLFYVPGPSVAFYSIEVNLNSGKRINRPYLIFHPPIA